MGNSASASASASASVHCLHPQNLAVEDGALSAPALHWMQIEKVRFAPETRLESTALRHLALFDFDFDTPLLGALPQLTKLEWGTIFGTAAYELEGLTSLQVCCACNRPASAVVLRWQ